MEKFVSCVTREQCSAVIQRMVAEGCRPINPDHVWSSYSKEVVIRKNNDKHISYANRQWYTDHGYGGRIITAHQYLNRTNKPILITRKGRVVTAEDKNTGEKAIATCCPTDTFDFGTGAMIAVARLIAQSDKGITKDAETVLRQLLGYDAETPADAPTEEEPTSKFKVDDIVTLKDGLEVGKPYGAVDLLEIMYSNGYGKQMKVVDTIKCEDGDMAYDCAPISGGRSFWYVEEMLEKWDESKIREGDIVRVINTGLNYSSYPRWVGEHISDPDMAARYCFGSPSVDYNYKVIKIAEHESNGRTLAYIEQCDGFVFNKCYLVEVKGLEKVTEE